MRNLGVASRDYEIVEDAPKASLLSPPMLLIAISTCAAQPPCVGSGEVGATRLVAVAVKAGSAAGRSATTTAQGRVRPHGGTSNN
jgi:hypothetical protein